MPPKIVKKQNEEQIAENRQVMAALLAEGHEIAVKQFGADVSPLIAHKIVALMCVDEEDNVQLIEDLAKAATVSVETCGDSGKAPEAVLATLETVFGYSEFE